VEVKELHLKAIVVLLAEIIREAEVDQKADPEAVREAENHAHGAFPETEVLHGLPRVVKKKSCLRQKTEVLHRLPRVVKKKSCLRQETEVLHRLPRVVKKKSCLRQETEVLHGLPNQKIRIVKEPVEQVYN